MAHHHHHEHPSARQANKKRLALALVLAAAYMIAEFIGGLLTNSLALLADAGHMLSDVAALGLGLFAVWISDRPSPTHRTYGYYRAEIFAAMMNGASLIAVSIYIFLEAYQRIFQPPYVRGKTMMWIAVGGLAINLAGLCILHRGRQESLNVRGAWLHVLSDALGSVGVILAGLLIWVFDWHWSDPVASALIAVLIVYSAWRLLAESCSVLMENAPKGIDVDAVRGAMVNMPGVLGVHDLHIWSITSGLESLSAHVVIDEGRSHARLLQEVRTMLHDRFGIDHITIQIEPEDFQERTIPV